MFSGFQLTEDEGIQAEQRGDVAARLAVYAHRAQMDYCYTVRGLNYCGWTESAAGGGGT